MTMVVGSICGGTGAGMFIQIPFYVKKIHSKGACNSKCDG